MAYREAKDGLSKPITPLENPLEKLNPKLETASIQNLFVPLIATTSVIEWFCLSMGLVRRFIFYWSVYIVVSCVSNIYLTYAGTRYMLSGLLFLGLLIFCYFCFDVLLAVTEIVQLPYWNSYISLRKLLEFAAVVIVVVVVVGFLVFVIYMEMRLIMQSILDWIHQLTIRKSIYNGCWWVMWNVVIVTKIMAC